MIIPCDVIILSFVPCDVIILSFVHYYLILIIIFKARQVIRQIFGIKSLSCVFNRGLIPKGEIKIGFYVIPRGDYIAWDMVPSTLNPSCPRTIKSQAKVQMVVSIVLLFGGVVHVSEYCCAPLILRLLNLARSQNNYID